MRDYIERIELKENEEVRQIVIDGKETKYYVSSFGRIFSFYHRRAIDPPRELSPAVSPYGYLHVSLQTGKVQRTFFVHRLVASAFIENPEEKPQINHKDGNKQNNAVENLEWATSKENINHAFQNGMHDDSIGEKHYNAVATKRQIENVCLLLSLNKDSKRDIAQKVGVPLHVVENVYSGKSWTKVSQKYDFSEFNQTTLLSEEKIIEICESLETMPASLQEIAERCGVGLNTVTRILWRKTHTDISSRYNIDNHYSFNKSKKRKKKIA